MLALQLLRAAAQIDLRADLASRHADLQDRPSPRGTDSAQNYLALIEHREFNDHPLLATEMVWWVIFALLILVGRPVWTMLSVFVHR
jgi:hypothetical protein